MLDGSGLPYVPGLPNPLPPGYPPVDPGQSNLTPPADPLAPTFVQPSDIVYNQETGENAATSVQ